MVGVSLFQTAVVTSLTTLGTLFAFYWIQKVRRSRIPTRWISVGYVSKVYIYPLKSGNRIEVDKAECTDIGLRQIPENNRKHPLRDRSLMVFRESDNEFRTARTYPKLLKVDISVTNDNQLEIDAPTMRSLHIRIPKEGKAIRRSIKCWGNELISVLDCGDEAAHWLSRYILGEDCGLRLGFNDGSVRRDIKNINQQIVQYYKNLSSQSLGLCHDLSSIHLINQVSVNELNSRISSTEVMAEQFRPNIIVDGPDLYPFDEDKWDFIKIGDQVITRNVKGCTRCIMTTMNPNTATRDKNREPLKTLEKYRVLDGPEKTPVMGVNLEVRSSGVIKKGDQVSIGILD